MKLRKSKGKHESHKLSATCRHHLGHSSVTAVKTQKVPKLALLGSQPLCRVLRAFSFSELKCLQPIHFLHTILIPCVT